MATPKKKHLIELMIEAGVKWPDGAEYAAQDKGSGRLYFFKMKPKVLPGDKHYWAPGGAIGYSHLLPSLCRNWHQTIVTREQYAEAVAAAGGVEQEQQPQPQPHSGAAGVMHTESIESLLAEIKDKREAHAALVTKAEALAIEIASIEQQVNDKLNEHGFTMYPLSAPSELVDTPWKIGDICIVTHSPDDGSWVGERCVITRIDSSDENLPYLVINQSSDEFWVRSIRRP